MRSQNSLLSINRLPLEILAHIFDIARMSEWETLGDPPSGSIVRLSLVCHHWRQVALAFPALWSTIHLRDGAIYDFQFAALCLERSKHAALSVVITTLFRGVQIANFFAPHAYRIQEISVLVPFKYSCTKVPAYLSSTCSFPAPKLRTLRLCTAMWGSFDCPVLPALFGGSIHEVTHLQIESFSSWPGHTFGRLTHLALGSQSQYEKRSSMEEFLDLLEANPRLEELLLDDAGPGFDARDSRPRINLPQMRLICFITSSSERALPARVLSHLTLPEECSIRVNRDMNPSRFDELLPSPFPSDLSSLAPFRSLDKLALREDTVEFGEAAMRFSATSRRSGVSTSYRLRGLEPWGPWPEGALLLFLKAIPCAGIRRVKLAMADTFKTFSEDEWRNIFDRLPALEELTVLEHHAPAILAALHCRGSSDEGGVPCPHLSSLQLLRTKDLDVEELLRLGRARASCQHRLKHLMVSPGTGKISCSDHERLRSCFDSVEVVVTEDEPIFEEPEEMMRLPFGKDISGQY
ncbi:hypothetical protein BV25DRAFT_1825681 [Artomyces pyxidatus]|uniref:Uncharacterized protein n=1 Tax=Artomyces pyxidatus TaxID=48021 RepID=A0ACB8T0F6_9AGAM|nr:hypothetical protein BV25DRAFT_1825681 [Artomyces pyxidatus]